MRGVVTLAAALALPPEWAGSNRSPRSLFVWLAFSVIVVTLVVQGTTLPLVARRLRIPPDDPMQDALAEAGVQQAASRAAQDRLDAELARDGQVPESVVSRLRTKLDDRTNRAWERLGGRRRETPSEAYARLRRAKLGAGSEGVPRGRGEGGGHRGGRRAGPRAPRIRERRLASG